MTDIRLTSRQEGRGPDEPDSGAETEQQLLTYVPTTIWYMSRSEPVTQWWVGNARNAGKGSIVMLSTLVHRVPCVRSNVLEVVPWR